MRARRVEELFVYRTAYEVAMDLFACSTGWPREEQRALTDQIRRSSRAVCANLAEAWAKRRYARHFVSKLTDAHAEAQETLTWLSFAGDCGYLPVPEADALAGRYDAVVAGLIHMARHASDWDPTCRR